NLDPLRRSRHRLHRHLNRRKRRGDLLWDLQEPEHRRILDLGQASARHSSRFRFYGVRSVRLQPDFTTVRLTLKADTTYTWKLLSCSQEGQEDYLIAGW